MAQSMIAVPEVPWHRPEARMRRFNETTGAFGYIGRIGDWSGPVGANHHPDRCRCQGNPNPGDSDYGHGNVGHGSVGPNGDTTPHKHREDGSCARCIECTGYEPMVER